MFRFIMLAIAAVAVSVGSVQAASAADMPVKAAPPAAFAIAPYNWTGFYVGGGVGWMHSSYDWRYTNPSPATCCAPFSASTDNAVGSLHVGAQYQWNQIVLGIEAAIMAANNSSRFASFTGCVAPNSLTIACQIQTRNIFTLGGRLGYAWNDWLLFGTGGWARGDVNSQLASGTGLVFDQTSVRSNGWYAGLGVEYVLVKWSLLDVIVGAEYQHIDLGTTLHLSPLDGFSACPPGVNCRDISAKEDLVRLRLSLKTH
jgi:outer membrane immunogenic protein